MVNMQVVRERLLKGAYVGVGSFVSGMAGSVVEDSLGTGDLGTSAGQVVIGTAVSVGADEVFGNRNSIPNDLMEFAGYGISGAGFANLGSAIQTGAGADRMITVSANAGSGSSGSSGSSGGSSSHQTGQNVGRQQEEFVADVG